MLAVRLVARTKWGDELRAASEPCCAGSGDGAGGSAVVGLDLDAGLIAALLLPHPAHSALRRVSWVIKKCIAWRSANQF